MKFFFLFFFMFLLYVEILDEAVPFPERYENNVTPIVITPMPIDTNKSQYVKKKPTTRVHKQPVIHSSIETKPPIKTSKKTYKLYRKTSLKKRLRQLKLSAGRPIFIRIFKKEALLEVWIKNQGHYVLLKGYKICAFSGHLGPKLKEGDRQAPEGFYRVKKRQLNPHSRYHLSFNLGYPNRYDKAHHRTGSYLMVHGHCVSIGCYAMTNKYIKEIYYMVKKALNQGQKYVQVHAFPFHMTDKNMAKRSHSRWYDFWTELKEGYDYFEIEKLPPHIVVRKRHYIINEAKE